MKISTKTGDSGKTSLFGGQRVKKSDVFMHALGELDELNSFLGLAKCAIKNGFGPDEFVGFFGIIEGFQDDIYRIMSVVGNKFVTIGQLLPIKEGDISYLESRIYDFEKVYGKIDKFVKPGENEISARLHVARSVCRRAERALVEVLDSSILEEETKENSDAILKYLNRLSDLLFLMAILNEK